MSKPTKTLRVVCAYEAENSLIASKAADECPVLDICGAEIRLSPVKALRLSRWLSEVGQTMDKADEPASGEEECI